MKSCLSSQCSWPRSIISINAVGFIPIPVVILLKLSSQPIQQASCNWQTCIICCVYNNTPHGRGIPIEVSVSARVVIIISIDALGVIPIPVVIIIFICIGPQGTSSIRVVIITSINTVGVIPIPIVILLKLSSKPIQQASCSHLECT